LLAAEQGIHGRVVIVEGRLRCERDGRVPEIAARDRAAYLVEGLGHYGACHTPRGWAFQEKALDG